MNRSVLSLTCLGAVAACTPSAVGFEFRTRLVQWDGAAWQPLCNNTLYAAPGSLNRLRLEFGVFDDAAGAAPAGGFVGWNVGTITATGGTNARNPGCLAPFLFDPIPFPPCPGCTPGPSCPDPFMVVTELDATLGTQSPFWGCSPAGTPLRRPAPRVYGLNEYVGVMEFTTVPGAAEYTITFGGNVIGASEWRVVGQATPPNCGNPNNPGDDVPGHVVYAPFTTDPYAFSQTLTVSPSADWDCLGDGVADACQGAYTERLYTFNGVASGANWSWCVNSPNFPSVCNLNVPGLAQGSPAIQIAERFADSINDAACPDTQLHADAYQLLGATYLVVSVASVVTGDTPFNLCFGIGGGPASCCPVMAFDSCNFNPTATRIPTSGQDCNGNGHDDTIDLVAGRSVDRNSNGVPDECEEPPCPADFNGDSLLNSQDFFDFLVAFFANDPAADFNADRVVNSQDFFDFVSAFFNGC